MIASALPSSPRNAPLIFAFTAAAALLCGTAARAFAGGPLDGAGQLVVVTTANFAATSGTLRRFERQGGRWAEVGAPVEVVVGKAGMGWGRGRFPARDGKPPAGPVKKEGDQRAPAGIFTLGDVTGYAQSSPPSLKLRYRRATAQLRCVDDPESPQYNRLAIAPLEGEPAWRSDEKMARPDGLYELTLFVEHNAERPVAGGGSCIFLHVAQSPPRPTVGCTAMTLDELRGLLQFLDPAKRPLLVQLPEAEYKRLRGRFELPALR